MAALDPPETAFLASLANAGITEAKPLHAVLLAVWQAAQAAREASSGARGLTKDGEAALIRRVAEAAAAATEAEAARIVRRQGLRLALAMAGCGLALLAGGYWYGSTYSRASAIEGAAFLAQIAELNDAGALRRFCLAHAYPQGGGTACALPSVWVTRQTP